MLVSPQCMAQGRDSSDSEDWSSAGSSAAQLPGGAGGYAAFKGTGRSIFSSPGTSALRVSMDDAQWTAAFAAQVLRRVRAHMRAPPGGDARGSLPWLEDRPDRLSGATAARALATAPWRFPRAARAAAALERVRSALPAGGELRRRPLAPWRLSTVRGHRPSASPRRPRWLCAGAALPHRPPPLPWARRLLRRPRPGAAETGALGPRRLRHAPRGQPVRGLGPAQRRRRPLRRRCLTPCGGASPASDRLPRDLVFWPRPRTHGGARAAAGRPARRRRARCLGRAATVAGAWPTQEAWTHGPARLPLALRVPVQAMPRRRHADTPCHHTGGPSRRRQWLWTLTAGPDA